MKTLTEIKYLLIEKAQGSDLLNNVLYTLLECGKIYNVIWFQNCRREIRHVILHFLESRNYL